MDLSFEHAARNMSSHNSELLSIHIKPQVWDVHQIALSRGHKTRCARRYGYELTFHRKSSIRHDKMNTSIIGALLDESCEFIYIILSVYISITINTTCYNYYFEISMPLARNHGPIIGIVST